MQYGIAYNDIDYWLPAAVVVATVFQRAAKPSISLFLSGSIKPLVDDVDLK